MLPVEQAVGRLRHALRLGEADARVYLRIFLAGPAKVSDVAEGLGVHRNDVYRATERLAARGLVQATQERPVRYAALAPSDALDEEVKARRDAIETLRATRESLRALCSAMRVQREVPQNTYKVIQGRREIHAAARRLIENAQETVDCASSFAATVRLWKADGLLSLLHARVATGVRARILVKARDDDDHAALDPFLGHSHAGARHFESSSIIRFMIVDQRKVLMLVTTDESIEPDASGNVAIETTADSFVEAQSLFFDQAWDTARPILARAPRRLGPGTSRRATAAHVQFPTIGPSPHHASLRRSDPGLPQVSSMRMVEE